MAQPKLRIQLSSRDRKILEMIKSRNAEFQDWTDQELARMILSQTLLERMRQIKNAVFGFTTQKY